jgi:uracil-DNA glycosylase
MSHRSDQFSSLLSQIRVCRVCSDHLPLGPRPVIRASPSARILIIGQAPGTRVHESGIPWNDRSGDRLREWLHLDKTVFYDQNRIAIVPMGFCYPGRDKNGGDAPPRRECAPLWHPPVLEGMPNIALTLLIGSYAQIRYLGNRRMRTMTETVEAWREFLPRFLPLPHPSWRNTAWIRRNPWFERDVLPELQLRVNTLLE